MGRKQRGNRRKGDDDDDDDDDEEDVDDDHDDGKQQNGEGSSNAKTTGSNNNSKKDLDFAQRRDLQRQQAADKRRAKMKCYVCGKTGHVRRECPGVQDDGKGMSKYTGKRRSKGLTAKKEKNQHQNQRSGSGTISEDDNHNSSINNLEYPEGFERQQENTGTDLDFMYYDISCDIGATMDYLKQGRGKAKISHKEAFEEYQQALDYANASSNFGGMISKSLLKPNRPWIYSPEDSPLPDKTWYMVGLARDYLYNDAEVDAAIAALRETVVNHKDTVVGFWAVLDFSPNFVKRPGCDSASQLRRVKATCRAAAEAGVTVQLQVLPGPATGLNPDASVAGTEYAQVLLELQMLLQEMIDAHPTLVVVLSNWAGMAKHMMTFLDDFPKENLVIGLDGAVSFSKASNLHECAFEVPLDRLVLETGTVIPSEIANALGREAFYHGGLWPFVAKAVADQQKTVSAVEIARATSELALQLYPQLAQGKANHQSEGVLGDVNDDHDDMIDNRQLE